MTATRNMPRALGGRRRAEPIGRYDDLPPSALLAQLFLATGWARAALAHGIDGAWWSGAAVREFIEADAALALALYRPFLDGIVRSAPGLIAAAVLGLQVVAAVSLGLNRRVGLGLGVSVFLNVHFVAAGAVNPSIFYLMLAGVLMAARLERSFAASAPVLRRRSRWMAGASAALLVPGIRSVAPEAVIEDPALVLLFVVALWTLVLHLVWPRSSRSVSRVVDLRERAQ